MMMMMKALTAPSGLCCTNQQVDLNHRTGAGAIRSRWLRRSAISICDVTATAIPLPIVDLRARTLSTVLDPRIEERVCQVNHQVRDDNDDRYHQHHGLDG